MSFVNLHGHSHYSLLDGFGSPRDIVMRAKELGYPAVALTDHGVTYGLIELYKEARKEGLKAVLGCEFYVAPRSRFDKEPKLDRKPYHLTILAENNTGYENILRLTTQAHLEGFYYKPRVDLGLLKAHCEGLIALSGCVAAQLPRAILTGNEDEIHSVLEKYLEIFGRDNYFLELQDHPLQEEQAIVNERLKKLAREYDLDLVVTCDSHYPRPGDSDIHDILLCIQTQTTVSDENRMRYAGDFSLRDVQDLKVAFEDVPEALENTVKIAERCNVEFEFGENLIPSFNTPQNEKPEIYLRQLCEDGLAERFEANVVPAEYRERLDFELKTVNKMGFETYFLIVHDFIKYAREQKIVVGPGRGSAAGSILAWSLNITDLDPIRYGLLFERFLNPERISMPDIDIDFADNRRDEVLNYVIQKYGRDNVAQIITFGTMAPKAAIRDVGRALGYPYAEVDQLSKSVPAAILGKYAPLEVSIKDDSVLREIYDKNERARVLLDYARRIEGTVRHAGTHACAVVISEHPLTRYTALQYAAGSSGRGEVITQYSAKPLEDLGLLKMDFLGLKNLTVIESTCGFVAANHGVQIDIADIPLDDAKTFKLLQRADTTGVFQLESGGMRRYLKQLKPTEFDDIVAMGALYRPGPMEWIPNYIRGKHNPEQVEYLDDSFKSILEPTHGVAVYQEQILQLARDFAGFTLGEADILRKAVGKKIASLLTEQREKFVAGAVHNGHKKKFAEEVFEKVIEPFAGYGFNKAHAACYGMIAYQTAYLKAHYPVEFMTALLCCDANNTDRVVLEIKECYEMGIDVLPPSVNDSFANFSVVGPNKIRFGLLAIKGVGDGPIGSIVDVREKGGVFKSIEDFAKRVPFPVLNKKVVQALAYSGALDDFGDRNQLAESYDEICKYARYSQESASNGQTDIFGMLDDSHSEVEFSLAKVPLTTGFQKLKFEKDFLGMYVSGHPLRGLGRYIGKKGQLIGQLTNKHVAKTIKVLGILTNLRKILTKSGAYMASFTVEDPSARISAIMFPKTMARFGQELIEDKIIGISGRLSNDRGQYKLICDTAKLLSLDAMIKNAKSAGLFDENDKSDVAIRLLDDILGESSHGDDASVIAESGYDGNVIEDFALSDPFIIDVPADVDSGTMQSLKSLLLRHKGCTAVELFLRSEQKKIRLPFGVEVSDALKASLGDILLEQ